jgi:hypothetical protein
VIRRQKLLDRPYQLRDASLCGVATEGERTEPEYFEAVRARLRCTRLQFVILPTCSEGKSAPNHVWARIGEGTAHLPWAEGDRVWLVVDRDRWQERGILDVIRAGRRWCENKRCEFYPAISNPCFEVWLLLHQGDHLAVGLSATTTAGECKRLLDCYSGADQRDRRTDVEVLRQAVAHATALDTAPDAEIPTAPGTRVYRLIEWVLSVGATRPQNAGAEP